jgi:hypothetical protein
MNEKQRRHYVSWGKKFAAAVRGSVGCVEGRVLHLWHGDLGDRQYGERHGGFARYEFDPYTDIALAEGGCWSWSSDKPEMHEYVRAYFASRLEDGPQDAVPALSGRRAAATR